MKLWKQYWLWIFLLVPATYLFLRPLLFRPELLQPILPDSWYDSWEEFAVMQLSGLLAFGMLSLAFLVFGIGIFMMMILFLSVFLTNRFLTKFVFQRISDPLQTLAEGVRQIRDGTLHTKFFIRNLMNFSRCAKILTIWRKGFACPFCSRKRKRKTARNYWPVYPMISALL